MALLGGQFKSATHGQFKSAQGGHFDRNLQYAINPCTRIKSGLQYISVPTELTCKSHSFDLYCSGGIYSTFRIITVNLLRAIGSGHLYLWEHSSCWSDRG